MVIGRGGNAGNRFGPTFIGAILGGKTVPSMFYTKASDDATMLAVRGDSPEAGIEADEDFVGKSHPS